MSQEKLGNAVSLTFQQIQKYERGANRIGSSRLFQFSKILNVPVSFFFDGMADADGQASEATAANLRLEEAEVLRDEAAELVEAYYRIPGKRMRLVIRELARHMAGLKHNRLELSGHPDHSTDNVYVGQ